MGWNPDTPLTGWQVNGVKFQQHTALESHEAQEKPVRREPSDPDVRRQIEEAREWIRLSENAIEAALGLKQGPQTSELMWPDITRMRIRGYIPKAAKEHQQPKRQASSLKLLHAEAELAMVDMCVQEMRTVAAGADCKACAAVKKPTKLPHTVSSTFAAPRVRPAA